LMQKDAEIVHLKEEVLSLVGVRKLMTDEAEAAKRRLRLLEEDLKSPMPFEKMNENKSRSENIKVYCRLRPFLENEVNDDSGKFISYKYLFYISNYIIDLLFHKCFLIHIFNICICFPSLVL